MTNSFKYDFLKTHQRTSLTNIHKKVIYFLQKKVNIEIEKEFSPYSADIYIPSLNVVVECDGGKWHNFPLGSDRDRKRDELIIKKYKVKRVYRIWDRDIKKNCKLSLILDGVLNDNVIYKLSKNDTLIIVIGEKHYKGIVKKVNKLDYIVLIPSLNKKVTIDRNGLFKINEIWYRSYKLTKTTAMPLWCSSISSTIEKVLKNKTIPECEEIISSIKKFISEKEN